MKIDVPGMALRRANARPMTGSAKQSIEPRRHCERSEAIHRAAAVIASAVKQSILSLRGAMDCFTALAMTTKHTFAASQRNALESCMNLPPFEGVGNAGCPLHPRPRVHLVLVERTRVTTSTPESPDVPARNGFNGFLRALPGDRALLPPSSTDRFCLSPVGPTQLRELDASVGASGPHDFAVRCNISRPHAL